MAVVGGGDAPPAPLPRVRIWALLFRPLHTVFSHKAREANVRVGAIGFGCSVYFGFKARAMAKGKGLEAGAGPLQFTRFNDLARGGTISSSIAFHNIPGPSVPPKKARRGRCPCRTLRALVCSGSPSAIPSIYNLFVENSRNVHVPLTVGRSRRSPEEPKRSVTRRELIACKAYGHVEAASERPNVMVLAEGQLARFHEGASPNIAA